MSVSHEEQMAKMAEEGFEEVPGTDGGLLKKILREGSGESPEKGNEVSVHYTGTLHADGSKFDSSRDRSGTFDFTVGIGQVIKGWDVGICTMKKGELCILRCRSDYAYGDHGKPPKIPECAILNFEVELFSFKEREKNPWEMSLEEQMAAAERYKAEGNTAFKAADMEGARAAYNKGLTFLKNVPKSETPEGQVLAKPLIVALYLNSAQANLKLGEAAGAVCDCDHALELDPENVKALFRRGQGNTKRAEFDDAIADLTKAQALDPENKDVAAELKRTKLAAKKQADKEKQMCAKMFGN